MPAPRVVIALALCLLLAAPPPAAAQQAPPGPAVTETAAGPALDLPCPPGATPAVALNGGPPRPATAAPAPAGPLAIALVVEAGAAMAEAGTPYSTRLADATVLAAALLDRAPAGSRLAVVAFDTAARLALPLTDDRSLARGAVTALAAGAAGPPALADALRLAAGELAGAPPGPRAAVVFTATPGAADAPALAPLAGAARLLIVGVGPGAAVAPAAGAPYVPFHADRSLALPELFATYDRAVAELLGGLTRVQLRAADLGPGVHRAYVTGCGEPVVASFQLERGQPPLALAALPAAALGLGAAAYLVLRRRAAAAPRAPATARYRAAAGVTTARREGASQARAPLWVTVWDGRERSVHRLAGRQLTVGREPGCDIRIESEWVSGLHARLTVAGGRVEIVDLGSTNGTFVGEDARPLAPGAPEPLGPGAVVLIGPEVRLMLREAGADDAGDGL